MNELEELKKELERALEKVNAKLDEYEGKYYTIYYDGKILRVTDHGTDVDIFNKEIGNYFRSKKEAEEYVEDLKVKVEIKKIAKELNENEEIDWDDNTQTKYSLMYDYDDSEVRSNQQYTLKIGDTIYCLDEHFADLCIGIIGEERLKNYLKRN